MSALQYETYVISLPERLDRRERVSEVLCREAIPFTFVDGVRVKRNEIEAREIADLGWEEFKDRSGWDRYICGAMGCKRAHIRCLEDAAAANKKSVLVLEDDVEFTSNWRAALAAAYSELPKHWLQLYFSAMPMIDSLDYSPHLQQLRAACQTTAILYSHDGIEAGLNCIRSARCELDWWMGLHLHPFGCSYVVSPQITYQREGYSDCRGSWRATMP
jgi:hypothetical protein